VYVSENLDPMTLVCVCVGARVWWYVNVCLWTSVCVGGGGPGGCGWVYMFVIVCGLELLVYAALSS
jgi:hypothetical protein